MSFTVRRWKYIPLMMSTHSQPKNSARSMDWHAAW
jgi:hypothetical protein